MVSKEAVRELIGDYTADGFVRILKLACAPAAFVSVGRDYFFRAVSDEKVSVLGVVRDLPGENGLTAPLLVADVPLSAALTERSSRIRQFKLAKKVLEHFAATPPMELDGVIAQGVFVFHDAKGRFRVSLVTATPENGKFNWSKARRQSFYVTNDPDANATFVQRMCMSWSTLKGIKEAFSVEKLTKEFYNLLFAWYERACDDRRVEYPNGLDTDADNREDKNRKHLLRLITRLMFVWFLKQKGLVPAELFDENYLRKILKDFNPVGRKQHQYYRAILQNLFFATLNSEIGDRKFADAPSGRKAGGKAMSRHHGVKTTYRYADEFAISKEAVLDLFRPIPFLNGGLFECLDQEGDDGKVMYYDGFSLQEHHRDLGTLTWAHVPNDLFFDPDYGIIPLLKRYNFTVEENSPGDEDVALDPELLGKVFENLLGAYNPETEVVVRNSTGSFYTPREIVNYMVDESLVVYLTEKAKADEATVRALVADGIRPSDDAICARLVAAVEAAKILDPACGSGAFPMGELLKMTELLRILKGLPEDANLYGLKLSLIENCIFGSDIQEIAVQISKLRMFISLVCEQKPDKTKPNYGINTLPNLETKFVAANSLIGLEKEAQRDLFFETGDIQETKDALWDVRHRHFLAKTRQEKNELRHEDKRLRKRLAVAAKKVGYSEESTRLMASWDPYNQNVHAEFFDPEWMFNVKDGFDIVIGNPPYGLVNKRQNKGVAIVVDEDTMSYYKNSPEFSEARGRGTINIYRLFIQKSLKLLSDAGVFSEIFPLAFAGDLSAASLRKYVFSNYQAISFDAFPERDNPAKRVFEAAKMSVCIFLALNARPQGDMVLRINTDSYVDYDGESFHLPCKSLIELDPEYGRLPIAGEIDYRVLFKVRGAAQRLTTVSRCATGELDMTFAREAFSKNSKFPKMLRGAGIARYSLPTIMSQGEHLFVNEKKLKDLEAMHKLRDSERIVLQGITGVNEKWRIKATLARGVYCANSANYIPIGGKKARVLLGVLNSRLMNFYFSKFSTNSNVNGYEVDALPVFPFASPKQQAQMIALVDRILSAKRRNPSADTSALEREIDALVYTLYGLSKDEIAVIEGSPLSTPPHNAADSTTLGKSRPSRVQGSQKKKRTPKFEEEF
ncbi:MAG: Eco57I restriction-modification methylase domain-containing protein [Kiritimatiellae bacterium]|nr:Eco57I restriction-modification methylase domain-containing protein [Kiritimatiellia bacterium]